MGRARFGRLPTAFGAAVLLLGLPRAAPAQRIYWAQTFGDRIRRANLDGSAAQTLIEPPIAFDPTAIRLDLDGDKLYWVETFDDGIHRANLDGTGIVTIIQPPASLDPIALDLDVTNTPSKVYWAQRIDDHILRANTDGTGVETLVQPPNSFDVSAIAVDGVNGVLYWAERSSDRIRRANPDGTNVQTFLDVIFVSDPVALAVDPACGYLYWAERAGQRIRRATLDGLTVETVLDSLFVTDPVAVAFVSDDLVGCGSIYWAEGSSNRIRRASSDGTSVSTVVQAPAVFDPISLDVDPRAGPALPPRPNQDSTPDDTSRYLGLSVPQFVTSGPPPIPQLTALRVRMVELQNPVPANVPSRPPPDFSAFEAGPMCADGGGCARWVGPVATFPETENVPAAGTFRAARLQCTPYYFDWSAVAVFYVTGAEIVASSKYDVENLGPGCAGNEGACSMVSPPLRVTTPRHGDVAAPFNPPDSSSQPNGLDVAGLLQRFRGLPGSPPKARTQLQPNAPEPLANINALDIVACLDAFRGFAYPFSGPCQCPSSLTCDTLPCSVNGDCTSLGVGSTCIRTCSGGSSVGLICRQNSHCPDGTCGPGSCRDRCARCTP